MDADHVYTKDELVNLAANFTDGLAAEVKSQIPAEKIASLENIVDGINQVFGRLDRVQSTVENLQKANEDYQAKIAQYAAESADRMRKTITDDAEADDPAQEALDSLGDD